MFADIQTFFLIDHCQWQLKVLDVTHVHGYLRLCWIESVNTLRLGTPLFHDWNWRFCIWLFPSLSLASVIYILRFDILHSASDDGC